METIHYLPSLLILLTRFDTTLLEWKRVLEETHTIKEITLFFFLIKRQSIGYIYEFYETLYIV